jgi:hypothetical protein
LKMLNIKHIIGMVQGVDSEPKPKYHNK